MRGARAEVVFAEKGIKKTKAREEVFTLLDSREEPLTAERIYLELAERGPEINLSTVYRTLELFVEKGLAFKENRPEERKAYYSAQNVDRHYLTCINCRQRFELGYCPLKDLTGEIAGDTDFLITSHRLEIYGYCPKCRASKAGS